MQEVEQVGRGRHVSRVRPWDGGLLPIMDYMGILHPKEVVFFRLEGYKRWGFHKMRYMKGKENHHYVFERA